MSLRPNAQLTGRCLKLSLTFADLNRNEVKSRIIQCGLTFSSPKKFLRVYVDGYLIFPHLPHPRGPNRQDPPRALT